MYPRCATTLYSTLRASHSLLTVESSCIVLWIGFLFLCPHHRALLFRSNSAPYLLLQHDAQLSSWTSACFHHIAHLVIFLPPHTYPTPLLPPPFRCCCNPPLSSVVAALQVLCILALSFPSRSSVFKSHGFAFAQGVWLWPHQVVRLGLQPRSSSIRRRSVELQFEP